MLSAIRQIHDGMRARVRMGDGDLSEWFAVQHCLCQGYIIPPLLFNIFFTAELHIAQANFNSGSGILRDTVPVRKCEKRSAVKECTVAWQFKPYGGC